MKLAVIDHIGNPGGGSRVARALLPAFKRVRPDLQITFFGNPHSIKREQIRESVSPYGIEVRGLSSAKLAGRDLLGIRGSRHVVSLFQRKLARPFSALSPYLSGAIHKELESVVRGFDFAFFTWPFHLECPSLSCPMAGIFHDFNFKYFFSGATMAPWVLSFLNTQMPLWLSQATPIVSTEFMRTELQKFYPDFGHKTKVVPVAPTSTVTDLDHETARKIIRERFDIDHPYLLCPTNIGSHKNNGALLSAFSLLKQKGYEGLLLFAGSGTEILNGEACSWGLELKKEPSSVRGLGYVTNTEIDALIQCASIVVNPSLYEGGNVPGFDAWAHGVPTAMSRIPTFLEHMEVHGVRSGLFDPRSPASIAEALEEILLSPTRAKEDAAHSQQAISAFTWEKTAEGYLHIFDEVLASV